MIYILLLILSSLPAPWWAIMASRTGTPKPTRMAIVGGLLLASLTSVFMFGVSQATFPDALFNRSQTTLMVNDLSTVVTATLISNQIEVAWTPAYGGYCILAMVDPEGAAGWDLVASSNDDCDVALFSSADLYDIDDFSNAQLALKLTPPIWQPAFIFVLIFGSLVFTLSMVKVRYTREKLLADPSENDLPPPPEIEDAPQGGSPTPPDTRSSTDSGSTSSDTKPQRPSPSPPTLSGSTPVAPTPSDEDPDS